MIHGFHQKIIRHTETKKNNTLSRDKAMNKIRFRYGKAIGTIKHETENRVNRLKALVEIIDNMDDQMLNYKKEHN